MRQASGNANITVITIILIGVVAALALVLIPRLNKSTVYESCCISAGGKWSGGICTAVQPVSCEKREGIWEEYDKCVIDNGKHDANTKYGAVSCTN